MEKLQIYFLSIKYKKRKKKIMIKYKKKKENNNENFYRFNEFRVFWEP